MKRWLNIALLTTLAWVNSTDPTCGPHQLLVYEAYINGPGTGAPAITGGYRLFPSTQTWWSYAPDKPVPYCAVSWRWPIAVQVHAACQADPNEVNCIPLLPECQPTDFYVDGERLWPEGA